MRRAVASRSWTPASSSSSGVVRRPSSVSPILSSFVSRSAAIGTPCVLRRLLGTGETETKPVSRTRPRRALFNVPGSDQRKIDKIAKLPELPDCIVLDLEDGVATNKKAEARVLVKRVLLQDADVCATTRSSEWLPGMVASSIHAERLIRTNAVDSGLLEEDVKACIGESARVLSSHPTLPPLGLVLPKCESAEHVKYLLHLLTQECGPQVAQSVTILAALESARGFHNIDAIAASAPGQLAGLIFASEDLCADMGMTRTPGANELLFFRSRLVLSALVHGLDAIDMVCLDFKNTDAMYDEALTGVQMGFTGKQAIHPAQIGPIYRAFRPSEKQLDLARRIIVGFHESNSKGIGAFEIDGKMIDMPMVKWAHKIFGRSDEDAPYSPPF